MRAVDRVATALIKHRRVAIPALLLVLVVVGSGVTQLEQDDSLQAFEVGSEEEAALEYVESNFSTGPANGTVAQVVVRGDDVLDKQTLLATLELQQEIRANRTVAPTLREDRPTVGIANVIARAAIRQHRPGMEDPTLAQQRAALQAMSQSQVDAVATRVLAGGSGPSDALALMPTDHEPGSANASATMVAVFQRTDGVSAPGNAPDAVVEAQRAVQAVAADSDAGRERLVVGNGIITSEQRQSRQDTMGVLGPLALVFVLVTLAVVYRDLVDVVLSLAGIVLVQLWTFGTLGWAGIPFNAVLIAVPVLLIGLSIDYGIHVVMRYRERRARSDDGIATAMQTALAGVGVALLWVTVTTVVGFLSNLASPVGPIRELGLIAAVGIVGALVVFGLLLPPLEVELDGLLERVGVDRVRQPVGTGDGRVARLLTVGSRAATTAPVVVLALALVLTAVTTAGAMQVSTSFEPEDNIADDPPGWTDHLPEGMQPGEYTVRENLRYVNAHFVRHGSQGELLVEGNVTHPDTLEAVHRAEAAAANQSTAVVLGDGTARTESPLTVLERVAARNPEFEGRVAAADTDGDGIPDTDLRTLYDRLFELAPEQTASVLHREDGEYVAARMAVSVTADAPGERITAEMEDVAAVLEGDGRSVTVTGDPVVNQVIQDYLLGTLLVSLLITLVAVLALLVVVYRLVHGSATLGLVTLVPVGLVVSWVIGTMYALGYPLSVLTTVIASITVGIGIDYSIHVSERFRAELAREGSIERAVTAATRGTGSALLGSAVTTAIGFGILGLGFLPALQQFGAITAVMIAYAFLASVLVLPSLLVLWARTFGCESWSDHPSPAVGTGDD